MQTLITGIYSDPDLRSLILQNIDKQKRLIVKGVGDDYMNNDNNINYGSIFSEFEKIVSIVINDIEKSGDPLNYFQIPPFDDTKSKFTKICMTLCVKLENFETQSKNSYKHCNSAVQMCITNYISSVMELCKRIKLSTVEKIAPTLSSLFGQNWSSVVEMYMQIKKVGHLMSIVDSKETSKNINDILEVVLCNYYLKGEKYVLEDGEMSNYGVKKAISADLEQYWTKGAEEIEAKLNELISVTQPDKIEPDQCDHETAMKYIQALQDIEYLKIALQNSQTGALSPQSEMVDFEGIQITNSDFLLLKNIIMAATRSIKTFFVDKQNKLGEAIKLIEQRINNVLNFGKSPPIIGKTKITISEKEQSEIYIVIASLTSSDAKNLAKEKIGEIIVKELKMTIDNLCDLMTQSLRESFSALAVVGSSKLFEGIHTYFEQIFKEINTVQFAKYKSEDNKYIKINHNLEQIILYTSNCEEYKYEVSVTELPEDLKDLLILIADVFITKRNAVDDAHLQYLLESIKCADKDMFIFPPEGSPILSDPTFASTLKQIVAATTMSTAKFDYRNDTHPSIQYQPNFAAVALGMQSVEGDTLKYLRANINCVDIYSNIRFAEGYIVQAQDKVEQDLKQYGRVDVIKNTLTTVKTNTNTHNSNIERLMQHIVNENLEVPLTLRTLYSQLKEIQMTFLRWLDEKQDQLNSIDFTAPCKNKLVVMLEQMFVILFKNDDGFAAIFQKSQYLKTFVNTSQADTIKYIFNKKDGVDESEEFIEITNISKSLKSNTKDIMKRFWKIVKQEYEKLIDNIDDTNTEIENIIKTILTIAENSLESNSIQAISSNPIIYNIYRYIIRFCVRICKLIECSEERFINLKNIIKNYKKISDKTVDDVGYY